jgi:hypothetical protein
MPLTICAFDARELHPGLAYDAIADKPHVWQQGLQLFGLFGSEASLAFGTQFYFGSLPEIAGPREWAILDSNQGPLPYQRSALTD